MTELESKRERLLDVAFKFLHKSNLLIGLLLFIIVLFLLSDFFTTYVLMPLKLADAYGPSTKGYFVVAGLVAILYLVINIIYQQYMDKKKE